MLIADDRRRHRRHDAGVAAASRAASSRRAFDYRGARPGHRRRPTCRLARRQWRRATLVAVGDEIPTFAERLNLSHANLAVSKMDRCLRCLRCLECQRCRRDVAVDSLRQQAPPAARPMKSLRPVPRLRDRGSRCRSRVDEVRMLAGSAAGTGCSCGCRGSRNSRSAVIARRRASSRVVGLDDQLRQHRIVVHRDLGALADAAVDADARALRLAVEQDRAGLRKEALRRILGVDAALDRVAALREASCVKGSGSPEATRNCACTRSTPATHFGDGMLDLQARVHFEEIEAARRRRSPSSRNSHVPALR